MTDLTYALRGFRRSPGFTLVAVLSLALGIGANVTIYTIANAFLNQRVAGTTDPDRLVRIYRGSHSPLQMRELEYVREHNDVFSGVIGERMLPVAVANGTSSERVVAALVTHDFFPTLGVAAEVGRLIAPADSADPDLVVISHALWERQFAGTPQIAGERIRVNDHAFTIVGVAPPEFISSQFLWRADIWFPPAAWAAVSGTPPERYNGSLYVTARLKPGLDVARSDAVIGTLAQRMRTADSAQYGSRFALRVAPAHGLTEELRAPATIATTFLLAVVGLVLLIACANVANLLLARAAERRKEIGVRIAMGAERWRLIRQLLTESALLSFGAAGVGLLAALWVADSLTRYVIGRSPEPIAISLTPDARVVAFTVVVSVLTTLLFGLLPALRATSLEILPVLREEAPQTSGRSRMRSTLVGLQVAWCTVLLACASLFIRSLVNARVMDPGFNPSGVVDVAVDLGPRHLERDQGAEFYRRLGERSRGLPGVRSATVAALAPLGGSNMQTRVWTEGDADARRGSTFPYFNVVGADYFETIGVPLVAGRGITQQDIATRAPVSVVNETMAKTYWPGENAIGKRISTDSASGPWVTVVGIARDTKYNSVGESTPPFMYLSFAQNYRAEMILQVRGAGANTVPLRLALPALVHELDPQLPPVTANTLSDDMRISLLPAQLGALLLGAFGGLALLLATVGIYGVTSYSVAQRTRELGIRSALGANARDVLRLILGQSLRVAAIGALFGLALALAVSKLIASQLYGVRPADPVTFIGMPVFLMVVSLLATLVPARRATRVDPVVALRSE